MAHWWFGCSGSHAIKGKHQRPDYRMYNLSPSPHCWEKRKGNQQNRKKHLKHTRQSQWPHRYYSFSSSWPVFISQVLCAGLSVQHPTSSGSLNTQPLREEGAQGQPRVTGWVEQWLRPRGCTLPGWHTPRGWGGWSDSRVLTLNLYLPSWHRANHPGFIKCSKRI